MELNDSALILPNQKTDQKEYTKESRLTRDKNIHKNNFYHKKNPKKQQQPQPPVAKKDSAKSESKPVNKDSSSKKDNKHNGQQDSSGIKPKLKNQLQMMFNNLAKIMKKEGLFIETNHSYEQISVMKDYNVQILGHKDKRHQLSVRAVIGQWKEFRGIVSANPNEFSTLKTAFYNWCNETVKNYDASDEVQKTYDKLMSLDGKDKRIYKFLPSLESKLIQVWRKPTKQPKGFLTKGNQVYDLWYQEAQEIHHIEQIESELNLQSYEQTFPVARSLNRKISILVGPTNSGKTYHALNELAKGRTGAYLAPLRLMAAEGQEALADRGIISNLITGEEQQLVPGATHTSSTVEMCPFSKVVDVAVIDEIQMIADPSRGWAWSQAMIGVSARHVVLVGSDESLPFILPVLDELGEEYEIKTFERKVPLHTRDPLWKLHDLKDGDCVVVFSRKNALDMKNQIEGAGKKCSVIYGNLSPEVRRAEAAKFKSGENPILVATDAIGMGLNLPIQRIFFSTLEKFDGTDTRPLTISEIKQIAGRAGRYGLAKSGDVGILFDNSHESKNLLHRAIYLGHEKATDTRIPIAPNLEQIKTICSVIGKDDLYSALILFREKLIRNHDYYKTANLESMIELAGVLKPKKLDLTIGFNYSCVPLDLNSDLHVKTFYRWINNHIQDHTNSAPALPDVLTYQKADSYSLYEAENYVKLCMSYRWLHYKYPEVYSEIETVSEYAKRANDYIEKTLNRHIAISKGPKWRK
jgi:hypothetical protein